MKTKDIFGLAVRLLGLVFLYHAFRVFPTAAAECVQAFPHELGPHAEEPMNVGRLLSALFMVGWPLLLAQWLVRGAPFIMQIAYPETPVRQQDVGAAVREKADA
jgi:hypothetical protein